jgi:lipoprotein signal peptidase
MKFVTPLIIPLVILVDQLTKWYVLSSEITPVYYNKNVGFSLPIPWFLPWLVIFGIVGYLYLKKIWLFSSDSVDDRFKSLLYASLSFIIGGGVSNILDRVLHNGAVIDFIDLHYWPVFNLADASICIGGALYIFYYYKVTHSKSG